ncbi:hypothetical protein QBK99_03120 [Corticibacterium sp. UT-5YL-CI-8]|nr:hypothetical protein [Tianweitania sp. UT-5YL-CI-8]
MKARLQNYQVPTALTDQMLTLTATEIYQTHIPGQPPHGVPLDKSHHGQGRRRKVPGTNVRRS